ncbi:MAG TPA: hypothetical protein VFE34_13210 [Dongiaceae bacterium]|jgi:hypothetical protein|nr:hypothetical protein [Dongiaceae bacterium]
MTTTQLPTVLDNSPTQRFAQTARTYLTGRRGLIALAVVALIAGAAFNWSWLVAAGIAPLLITALPCIAMCALGLCMNRMAGRKCSAEDASSADKDGTDVSLRQ